MCFRCSRKRIRCFSIETMILMIYHTINKERNRKKPTQKGDGSNEIDFGLGFEGIFQK